MRRDLDRLGLMKPGKDRIHVDDVDLDHGGGVLRAAAGKTSLSKGGARTLDVGMPSPDFMDRNVRPGENELGDSIGRREELAMDGRLDAKGYAKLAADKHRSAMVVKRLKLAKLRESLPAGDKKKTFVNMSWGTDLADEIKHRSFQMATAEPGSTAYKQVRKLLGRAPKEERNGMPDRKDMERIQKELLLPEVKKAFRDPKLQAELKDSKDALAKEVAEGRKRGILAFQSAGNSHADAVKLGDPALAKVAGHDVPGIITVGATNIGKPHDQRDNKMWAHSADGKIGLSAPGHEIPTGGDPREPNVSGTSLSTPIAVSVAHRMAAVNPKLSVDQIAKLMTDPRALNDIKGTQRDGPGEIDSFAAVLLAKNPKLTRAQIDQARALMRTDPSVTKLAQLRARLSL